MSFQETTLLFLPPEYRHKDHIKQAAPGSYLEVREKKPQRFLSNATQLNTLSNVILGLGKLDEMLLYEVETNRILETK